MRFETPPTPKDVTPPNEPKIGDARLFTEEETKEIYALAGITREHRPTPRTDLPKQPLERRAVPKIVPPNTHEPMPRGKDNAIILDTEGRAKLNEQIELLDKKREENHKKAASLLRSVLGTGPTEPGHAGEMNAQGRDVAFAAAIADLERSGFASKETKERITEACEIARTALKERAAYLLAMNQPFQEDAQFKELHAVYTTSAKIHEQIEAGTFAL